MERVIFPPGAAAGGPMRVPGAGGAETPGKQPPERTAFPPASTTAGAHPWGNGPSHSCQSVAGLGQKDTGRGRLTRDIRAPEERSACVCGAGLHPGRAQLVQVHAGRRGRMLRPLFTFLWTRLFFLAPLHDGQASHDGRKGNQTDTQSANMRLPARSSWRAIRCDLHRTSANSVPNDRSYVRTAPGVPFAGRNSPPLLAIHLYNARPAKFLTGWRSQVRTG